MTTPSGSPGWQMILLGLAALFVLLETWRGWRAGLVRSGMHLAALVLSTYLGYSAAVIVAAPLGGFNEMSGLLTGAAVGVGVCVVVFVVMWILSSILFKRTAQQSSGVFKFLWGSGGAFFGFVLGLLIVWSAVSAVRTIGALAASRLPSPTTAGSSDASDASESKPSIASRLVTIKESLEMGPLGKAVEATDPISPDVYQLIEEVGKVTGDQQTMMRFLEYPGLQSVLQSPKGAELLADPSVLQSAQSGNFLALMSHPALLAAAQDPVLAEELKKVDLRAALKFALEKPTASPAPSPPAKK